MNEKVLLGLFLLIILLAVIGIILLIHYFRKKEQYFLSSQNQKDKDIIYDMSRQLNEDINDIKLNVNQQMQALTSSLNSQFINFYDRTSTRIDKMESAVSSNLSEQKNMTLQNSERLSEKLSNLAVAQNEIKSLSSQLLELQNVLQDKKLRGNFGEFELYSLLKMTFGDPGYFYKKQVKLKDNFVVDALIVGFDGVNNIPIDSKFPLDNYRRLQENLNEDERKKVAKAFGKDVLKHIDDIASKYIVSGITSDFAFMFIPAEAIYAEIYANFLDVVEISYNKRVYMVSPTTLMAYLTAIKSIYLQVKRDRNILEIVNSLEELNLEFKKYAENHNKQYKSFENFVNYYQKEAKNIDKLLKRFAELYEGENFHEDKC